MAKHDVAVVDLTGQNPYLTGSTQTLLAITLDIYVCAPQRCQNGLVRRNADDDARVLQFYFKGMLPGRIQRSHGGYEMLDPK